MRLARWLSLLAVGALLGACGSPCGPGTGVVKAVIDGDTIELQSGVRVRYLNVDAPESTGGKNDCYGVAAADLNRSYVEGKTVQLTYDEAACTDKYERTLAWVKVEQVDVNKELVSQGYACSYSLPPAGASRVEEFDGVESEARTARIGLWGSCTAVTCDR